MSEFDKEAERERLREKYEEDKEKRAATEQMSELLLQGATMTNAHCSQCGDPIFRYDGQEFCATCERPVDRGDRSGEGDTDGRGGNALEVTNPSEDTRVVFGGDGGGDERQQTAQSRDASGESTDGEAGGSPAPERDQPARRRPRNERAHSNATGDAGVDEARTALVRTLVEFSQRAAAADDPRQATANLEAAREAAETLRALR